ncbi:MAG: carboxypeptidase regulatory-like domain-containing protein [Candidatus Acidiferrales bacterium]
MRGVFSKWRSIFTSIGLLAVLCICAAPMLAQTSTTGALTGTVTDPSGSVIAGATVTATNNSTGKVRTTSTDAKGAYEFSLLPPGAYSVKFSATGFGTSEVNSVNVNVTEIPVLNRSLQVGSQSQQVTVEANAVAIQTQNATIGGVISSHDITNLPLSTRNYTQILDLSPGVQTNVANASGFGNGTQDVNVNGSTVSSNNYSMNGVDVSNYTTGMAGQESTYVPIPVPNPDTIQEFRVQTAQYDAAYGRNSGADVVVVTKSGTNQFHGDAWEFNRNNFFNANDFFNKNSEIDKLHTANSPQILKQNQFGFTFGGPIMRNRMFFFGSYQGTRQINGAVPQGFTSVNLPNVNDYADVASGVCADIRCTNNPAAYQAFLGRIYGAGGPEQQGSTVSGFGPGIAADGSNVSPVSINILQAHGLKGGYNQGFFVPGAPSSCAAPCLVSIVSPARANENQYLINTDYNLSSRNTLSERFFYSSMPTLTAFGSSLPGSPSNQNFATDTGSLKLTSILTSNLVNEATIAFNRASAAFTNGFNVTACQVGITPAANNGAPCPLAPGIPAGIGLLPSITVSGVPSPGDTVNVGAFSMGGSVFTYGSSVNNVFQYDDQLSWNHGRHSIRVGVNAQRTQWMYALPSENKQGMSFLSMGDFLYGGPGTIAALGAAQVRGLPTGIGVNIRETDFSSYFQDDIKVNNRLTVDAGVRWEYEGLPYGADGQLTNVWPSLLSTVNTGSFFAPGGNPANSPGTLAGYVVQSTFPVAKYGLVSPTGATGVFVSHNNKLLPGGAPRDVFDPRLGIAWQPLGSKLVVRAGYGWFHDHIAASLIGKELDTNPPEIAPYTTNQLQFQTIANPFPTSFQGLTCTATGGVCPELGWTPRSLASPFTVVTVSPNLRIPFEQEYNLDLQYAVAPGWLVSIGYVGSHAVGLEDEGRAGNLDYLIEGAPNTPAGLFGEIPENELPYNDPLNPAANWVTTNQGPGRAVSTNELDRVRYLGIGTEGGLYQILTDGKQTYNSLQASVQHQFSHGLSFQASYTWSKAMTDVSGGFTGAFAGEAGNLVEGGLNSGYSPNSAQQYGLSEGNRPQRLVLSYTYNLPYKGTGWRDKVLAGWVVSGVTTVQDGEYFSVTDGLGGTIYGATLTGGNSRAEIAHPVNCNALGNCQSAVPYATPGSTESRRNCWVAVASCPGITATNAAFAPSGSEPLVGGTPSTNPGPYTGACTGTDPEFVSCGTAYGNSSVGVIMGPGQFNFDMALAKTIPVTEGTRLEFRAEAFNIWNHTQFNPPSFSMTSPTFGVITSDSVPPRIFQFGLKFYF